MKQEEYFGYGAADKLEEILKKNSVKSIFLVTGKNSYSSCSAEKMIEPLLSSFFIERFFDFEDNPRIEDVRKGIAQFKKNNFDAIIAVGGGSVIDMAKLINAFAEEKEPIEIYLSGEKKVKGAGKFFSAVPTTSGTGSESTHFAVIYKDKVKYSFAHESLMPDAAIIDPQFTFRLSPVITAATGMDALSQAMESYWSINSTEESKRYSEEAIKLAIKYLKEAVNSPSREDREKMAKAAHLSGKAINIAKTTAPHAISYAFTSYFGVKHGHAVGLTLGEILFYNSMVNDRDVADARGIAYVNQTIDDLNKLLGCNSAKASRNILGELMNDIGLETNLKKIGLKNETDINIILDNVNPERVKNNPRTLTTEALKEILLNLMK